jgi:hypothetical protein
MGESMTDYYDIMATLPCGSVKMRSTSGHLRRRIGKRNGILLGERRQSQGYPHAGEALGTPVRQAGGGGDRHQGIRDASARRTSPMQRGHWAWVLGVLGERPYLLADTGRRDGRRKGGELEMTQNTRHHRLLGDDGDEAQGAPATHRTGGHLQTKDAIQEPGASTVRGARPGLLCLLTL